MVKFRSVLENESGEHYCADFRFDTTRISEVEVYRPEESEDRFILFAMDLRPEDGLDSLRALCSSIACVLELNDGEAYIRGAIVYGGNDEIPDEIKCYFVDDSLMEFELEFEQSELNNLLVYILTEVVKEK